MKETFYPRGWLYLHPNGIEMEHEAIFRVEAETYLLEPYSWGQSRGYETEISATLVRFSTDRTREDAVKIDGEAEIARQEELFAETFDVNETFEDAVHELAEYRSDMREEMRWAAE